MLAIADSIMADASPLYQQLQAVKPDGLSDNAWTQRAGVSRMALADIKRRGTANQLTVSKLLSAIGATYAEMEAGAKVAEKEPSSEASRAPLLAFRGDDRPRDVPVVGTAECADIDFQSTDDGCISVEAMELTLDEIVDHVRRPLSLDHRRDVYAIYFRGHSMAPRYEPGELAYVDPKRPPSMMDYVVVQLRRPDGDGERIFVAMAKRLVRQSGTFLELQQYDPPARFRVDRKDVAHVHRIIPWDELVSF